MNLRGSLPARSESPPVRRRGLLYGRRKGPRLSARQSALFESLFPQLKLDLGRSADPRGCFDFPVAAAWLEIGFGAGEHLLWQALHHPDIAIIGAEPYESGVAKLLSKISSLPAASRSGGNFTDDMNFRAERAPCPDPIPRAGGRSLPCNIRIYQGDARDVIEAMPDASLDRVFLLFPDPWPKRRHRKRRFIQTPMLDVLARVMKSDAEFRFASDDADYVAWTLECFLAHEHFEWRADCAADWRARPSDWPPTRYEQKALRGAPAFLRFGRRHLQEGRTRRT